MSIEYNAYKNRLALYIIFHYCGYKVYNAGLY